MEAQAAAPTETVSATLRDILDAQGDNPAYLIDARLNLLAWNQAATGVFGFAEDLAAAPAEERNLLWLIFTDDVGHGWWTGSAMPSPARPIP